MKIIVLIITFLCPLLKCFSQCDTLAVPVENSVTGKCMYRFNRLVKDKPFLNDLKKYPYIVCDNSFWIVCIKKDAYYETYQGIPGGDVYLHKNFSFCNQIDDAFDLLYDNIAVSDFINFDVKDDVFFTYFLVSDSVNISSSFIWSSYSKCKRQDYINSVIISFWQAIFDKNIMKLMF